VNWIQRRLDDPPVQITISLLTPFVAYLGAEQLGLSGVLAVVTAGLYIGWRSPLILTARTRLEGFAFWRMVVFLLNGLIFILIGLQLPAVVSGLRSESWLNLLLNAQQAMGDDLRFYYGGRTYRHAPYKGKDTSTKAGCIGLATIKRDRFVSLGASFDGGQIVTKPLSLAGKRLHLNAKSDFGVISVEALDDAGTSIATSKPIRADSLDASVEWERPQSDNSVSLRISLKNACLYALWCD
jgi:hypothetical protein